MQRYFNPSPAPHVSAAELSRMAAQAVDSVQTELTPQQDLHLFNGLFLGVALDVIAAELVLAPHVVKNRCRVLCDGMRDSRGALTLDAQVALLRHLRDRASRGIH